MTILAYLLSFGISPIVGTIAGLVLLPLFLTMVGLKLANYWFVPVSLALGVTSGMAASWCTEEIFVWAVNTATWHPLLAVAVLMTLYNFYRITGTHEEKQAIMNVGEFLATPVGIYLYYAYYLGA